MKKILNHPVLASLLLFFLFIIFTVYPNIFTESELPSQLMAALLGAIITGFITIVLLKGQSEAEEVKERNVKVFEEKAKKYNDFIKELWSVWEDRKITIEELNKLFSMVSKDLIIYSNQETTKLILEKLTDILKLSTEKLYYKNNKFKDISNNFLADLENERKDLREQLKNNSNNKDKFNEIEKDIKSIRKDLSAKKEEIELEKFSLVQHLIQNSIFDIINQIAIEMHLGGKIDSIDKELINQLEKAILPSLNTKLYKDRFLNDFNFYMQEEKDKFIGYKKENINGAEYLLINVGLEDFDIIVGQLSGRSFGRRLPKKKIIGYYFKSENDRNLSIVYRNSNKYEHYLETYQKEIKFRSRGDNGDVSNEERVIKGKYNILKDYSEISTLVNFDEEQSVKRLIMDYSKFDEDESGQEENPAKILVDEIVNFHKKYYLRDESGLKIYLDEIIEECNAIEEIEKNKENEIKSKRRVPLFDSREERRKAKLAERIEKKLQEREQEKEKRKEEMREILHGRREERMSRRKSKNDSEEIVNSDKNDS